MSADLLDDAAEREQEMRDDGIAEARRRQDAKVLRPIGICYNCLGEIQEGLYCDDECKKDHIHRLTTIERTHAR